MTTFTDKQRRTLARKGDALPDGSYPIRNVADLEHAVEAIGRAKNPDQAKAHIKTRARALHRTDLIPTNW